MHKPTAISITAASALLLTVGGFGGGGGGDGGSGGVSNSGFLFHCRSSFPSFFLFLFFFFFYFCFNTSSFSPIGECINLAQLDLPGEEMKIRITFVHIPVPSSLTNPASTSH